MHRARLVSEGCSECRTDIHVLQGVHKRYRRVRGRVLRPVLRTPVGGPERTVEESIGRALVAAVVVVGHGRRYDDLTPGQGAKVVEAVVCEVRG